MAFPKEISNAISLDADDRKSRVRLIEEYVKTQVVNGLKNDPLFKLLFQSVYHTGSYFDGLRCGVADEFDLNLVFDIRPLEKIFLFESKKVEPGFVAVALSSDKFESIGITQPDWRNQWDQFIKSFVKRNDFNGKLYLSPLKVRQWFQSVLERSRIKSLTYPGVESVTVKASGPAWTLEIKTSGHSTVTSVDLVIGFSFGCEKLREYDQVFQVLTANGWLNEKFFIIPKTSKKAVRDSEFFWRLDFHDIEKRIVSSEGFSKNTIRLLKAFRDSNQILKDISSYALKSIVMLMIRKKKYKWIESNSVYLFLEAIKLLMEKMKAGSIPYLFHPQCDLLWSMNSQQRSDIGKWLERTIRALEGGGDTNTVWKKYFGNYVN